MSYRSEIRANLGVKTDKELARFIGVSIKKLKEAIPLDMRPEIGHQKTKAFPKQVVYSQIISRVLRFQILARDGFRCRYCGRTTEDGVKLHVDHIISVADGGQTIPANLLTACKDCNMGKFNRSVLSRNRQIPSFLALAARK